MARRRRSALQTPAFVDRMDMAEDAVGRVAIFSIEAATPEPAEVEEGRTHAWPPARWVAAVADDPAGAAVLAIGLVLLLVIGLRLTH